ncbi:MAG: Gfo/Idh/MocA family oxidoreductase [Caldilineaceae bacterium]|nr:Gfo/Idh/MocA family oxidoreductase [Caldilineaceae bacterium]
MQTVDSQTTRSLRLGMVGGGPGSHIGATHRQAARMDGHYDLVAGVFASDAERSRVFAATLAIAPDRRYGTWQEMAEQEAGRADGIEVVAIMTPNDSHYAIARAFLERGVHVICDKPLTNDLAQATELQRLAQERGLVFGVTFNYSGYPMVRARRAP